MPFCESDGRGDRKIPCLLYRMQLIVDLEGLGEEVYTLVDKEMEVVAK